MLHLLSIYYTYILISTHIIHIRFVLPFFVPSNQVQRSDALHAPFSKADSPIGSVETVGGP